MGDFTVGGKTVASLHIDGKEVYLISSGDTLMWAKPNPTAQTFVGMETVLSEQDESVVCKLLTNYQMTSSTLEFHGFNPDTMEDYYIETMDIGTEKVVTADNAASLLGSFIQTPLDYIGYLYTEMVCTIDYLVCDFEWEVILDGASGDPVDTGTHTCE